MNVFQKPFCCQPPCVSPNASPRAKVGYLGMHVGCMCVKHIDDLYMSKACVCLCDTCIYAEYSHGQICLCVVWGAYAA